jgi:hypothetical protein
MLWFASRSRQGLWRTKAQSKAYPKSEPKAQANADASSYSVAFNCRRSLNSSGTMMLWHYRSPWLVKFR